MKCQVCGKREATVQYTHIADNEKKSVFMCSECMAAQESRHRGNSSSKTASSSKTKVETELKKLDEQGSTGLQCASCGTTYEEFRKHGRFGCPECYRAFASELEKLMKRIHGRVSHKGKGLPAKQDRPTPGESLVALQHQLAEAVAAEAYEQAAELRDRIQALGKGASRQHPGAEAGPGEGER